MQFYVRLACGSSHYFSPVTAGGQYLVGISQSELNEAAPVWAVSDPVTFPLRSALFVVRELRRVGWNVSCRPVVIYKIRRNIKAKFDERRNSRKADPWRK